MERVIVKKDEGGLFDIRPIANYFASAKSGSYMVEVKRIRNTRSLDQNAWLWGCIYPLLLTALNAEGWEFTTTDEVHEFFKGMFRKTRHVNKLTGEVVEIGSSTANMDTAMFSEYCEQLRNYGRDFLNVEIPDPDKLWREKE